MEHEPEKGVSMNSETRDRLVEQFRTYLDDTATIAADDKIETVCDVATEASCDLFSLFTELAALRNEVRLESRQLKVALEKIGDLSDSLRESNQQLTLELNTQRNASLQAMGDAESTLLLEIVDLRDRLQAGLSAAQGYRATGLARLSNTPSVFIESLADGMAISLRRTDELLTRYRVVPLAAKGQRLDPSTMHANAVESHQDQPDGTVLSEVRRGYSRNDEVLRIAEVIVNKHHKD